MTWLEWPFVCFCPCQAWSRHTTTLLALAIFASHQRREHVITQSKNSELVNLDLADLGAPIGRS